MRLKGVQIEEERLQDIERKNHILLNRISFQMLNPSEMSNLHIHTEEETLSLIIDAAEHKRKRDKEKITKENLIILQRIEDKAPNYNRLEWFYERRKNLEHLVNISKYPYNYLDDLDDYEEQFPYHGRIPGAPTHHQIRAQTHNPGEKSVESEEREQFHKNVARPATEPMRKIIQEEPQPQQMQSVEAEEPLISLPSSESTKPASARTLPHSSKPVSNVASKAASSHTLIPEELVAEPEVVSGRQTVVAADIPESISVAASTANLKSASQAKLDDNVSIQEIIKSVKGSAKSLSKIDSAKHSTASLGKAPSEARLPPKPASESTARVNETTSAVPKSLKSSTKSLSKAVSEPQMSGSKAGSRNKLSEGSPTAPKSLKNSNQSLKKAVSESRVIGVGGSLVGSRSRLQESFIAEHAATPVKASSLGKVSSQPNVSQMHSLKGSAKSKASLSDREHVPTAKSLKGSAKSLAKVASPSKVSLPEVQLDGEVKSLTGSAKSLAKATSQSKASLLQKTHRESFKSANGSVKGSAKSLKAEPETANEVAPAENEHEAAPAENERVSTTEEKEHVSEEPIADTDLDLEY
ncbi:hypothetical protein HDU98_003853 [Podochytrium sp. JEL0797]|nr:hypothetical protein HDU98_003853 [Podochytrium sp. JEL0797]